MRRALWLTVCFAALLSISGSAQSGRDGRRSRDGCSDGGYDRRYRHCEERESTVPGQNPLDVDSGGNGGIRVRGWDRAEVHVRARIAATADTEADARRLASAVRIEATSTSIRADGPATGDDEHWSVSFELDVPRNAMLSLHTINGGISIEDFRGTAKFQARNGGISLRDVGGDIRGATTNGGINVDLSGDHWDGAGLDVETHNGGVRLNLPDNYSASIETGTVNGRVNSDFPATVQGRISRQLTMTIGAGGAKLRAMTTNGGISIRRR